MAKTVLDRMSPGKVFLVDGLGALMTAGGIYTLATFFIEWVGLPYEVMRVLTLVALVMAAYSLGCHFLLESNKKRWLRVIIIANLVYILATAILLWMYHDRVKWPGLVYFLSEFVVVLILVRWEASISSQST